MARKAVKIPTYTQGALTPKENFVAPTPNIKSFTNIVETISGVANKIADAQAVQTAFEKGKAQQTKSFEVGSQNYLGDFMPGSLTGEAYKKGANAAYIVGQKKIINDTLLDIASNNPLDSTKYAEAANEFKTEYLGTLPSSIQTDMSLQFDQTNQTFFTQIKTKELANNKSEQLSTITGDINSSLLNINGILNDAGLIDKNNIENIDAPISEIVTQIKALEEAQFSFDKINLVKSSVKESVKTAIIKELYKAASDDEKQTILDNLKLGIMPKGYDELIAPLDTSVIKFSGKLGMDEVVKLHGNLEAYKSEYIKKTAAFTDQKVISLDNKIKQLENNLITKEEVVADAKNLIAYKENDWFASKSIDIEQAAFVGAVTKQALKFNYAENDQFETFLENERDTKVAETTDTVQKAIIENSYNAALDKVKKIKEDKEKAMNGTGGWLLAGEYMQESGLEFTYDGLMAAATYVQNEMNVDPNNLTMSSELTDGFMNNIFTVQSSDQSYQLVKNDLNNTKDFYNKIIVDGTQNKFNKTIQDAGGNAASIALIGYVQADDRKNYIFHRDAMINKTNNLEIVKANDRNWTNNKRDFIQSWNKEFDEELPQTTAYGKSQFHNSFNAYLQIRANDPDISHSDAVQLAKDSTSVLHTTHVLSNGENIMLPTWADQDKVISNVESFIKNPFAWGLKVPKDETRESVLEDVNENYKMHFENGSIMPAFKRFTVGGQPLQVYSKTNKTAIIGPMVINVTTDETVGSHISVTKEWEYEKDSSFFTKFEKNYKPTKTVSGDILGTPFSTTVDKKVDEKVTELANKWTVANSIEPLGEDANESTGTIGFAYEDSSFSEFTNNLKVDGPKFHAISQAIQSGNVQEYMLEWLSQFPTMEAYADEKFRAEVLKNIKSNPNILIRKTNGTQPVRLTPLQTIADIAITRTNQDKETDQLVEELSDPSA